MAHINTSYLAMNTIKSLYQVQQIDLILIYLIGEIVHVVLSFVY